MALHGEEQFKTDSERLVFFAFRFDSQRLLRAERSPRRGQTHPLGAHYGKQSFPSPLRGRWRRCAVPQKTKPALTVGQTPPSSDDAAPNVS